MADPSRPDRREWLQGTAVGAALTGVPLAPPAGRADEPAPKPSQPADFVRGSAALEPDAVVASACQFCNSLCGLQVHLKAGRVIDIKGEDRDPVQAGGLCVKGPMMAQLVYNRHRLTHSAQARRRQEGRPGLEVRAGLAGTTPWPSSPRSSSTCATPARRGRSRAARRAGCRAASAR